MMKLMLTLRIVVFPANAMKIYSTSKKIERENNSIALVGNTNILNDDDETDADFEDSREKTPVPPNFDVKPSEIDDLAAQFNTTDNISSDSEVQFNIRRILPADTSFQSASDEAEFSISDAGPSKLICNDND